MMQSISTVASMDLHSSGSDESNGGPSSSLSSSATALASSRKRRTAIVSPSPAAADSKDDDDDNDTNPSSVSTTSTLPPRNKGLVKFPSKKEKMEDIRRRSSISDEQLESLWLNYSEFCSLRREVSEGISANKDRGYSKLLIGTLDDERLAQIKLDMWAKPNNDFNQRGLERHVSSEHREWRDSHKHRAVQAVLEAQEKHIAAILREEADFDEFGDYLATISIQHTQPSKEFAQMMAKADEKAVHRQRVATWASNPKNSSS